MNRRTDDKLLDYYYCFTLKERERERKEKKIKKKNSHRIQALRLSTSPIRSIPLALANSMTSAVPSSGV